MQIVGEKVFVTGGAGFIGSHLVDKLIDVASKTVVFDSLSTGRLDNLANAARLKQKFAFVRGTLLDVDAIGEALDDCSIVFHLAASPDVRTGVSDPLADFEQNLVATRNLLEAMTMSESAKNIVFASTSTVYGEAKSIPTREDYGPMMPVSLYGATKLGCEALIMAYCHLFDIRAVIYRFANVVGPRSRHGVIYDFIEKLRSNRRELEVLGDGTQSKSYLAVDDCVEAFLFGLGHASDRAEVFNVGSEDRVDVKTIAEIVIEEMGLRDVKLRFIGEVDGRGWPGDVKEMQLDIGKIKRLGWKPKHRSIESVRLAARATIRELTEH